MENSNYCFNCRKENVEYTEEVRLYKGKFRTDGIYYNKVEDPEYGYYDCVTDVAYCKECGDIVSFSGGNDDEDIRLSNNKIRIKLDILTTEEIIRIVDYIGKEEVAEKLEREIEDINKMCQGLMISRETSNKLKGLLKEVKYKD